MSDPQNQTFAPDLAESWDIASAGSSYTFHIRRNARWHDGAPLTAADVEFTYTMALHPDTTSNLAGQFGAIRGAADYTSGKAERVTGVTVLDDYTIRFDMETPNGISMIQTVPGPTPFGILPKHLLRGVKPADLARSPQLTTAPVGCGPFKFVRYVTDQFIEMQANPDYHFGKPMIDKLVFNIVQSPDATSVAMDRGEIDMPLFDTGAAPADMYRTHDNTRSWIAAEQQMLGDVGIQININEMDVASWVNQFYNEPHDFEAVRVTFGAFPDPDGFLSFHMQTGSKNAFGYSNSALDQKIKSGEQQIEQAQRVPIYQDPAQQMLTDLPVAPVVWQNTWLIQNRRFHIPQFETLTHATSLSDVPLATRFLTGADYFKFRMDQWTLG